MPDVYVANQAVQAANNTWTATWKLTRAMKKAGWRYFGSSNGVSKDITGNPSADYWGAQTQVVSQNGTAASLTTTSESDITVTGLTGMTAASVGRYLRVSGAASAANNGTWQITGFFSATSVKIRNASAVASDANNGSITWFEDDPILDAYPSLDGVSAWWGARGPDVLKIAIGAASTGTFLRGENITQSGTSATGELLGYAFNTSTDSFIVVLPRSGTFNGSGTLTGNTSGATVVPTASPITFSCEVVFWKAADTTTGTSYYVRADLNSESGSLFSTLDTAAGCTATIAPGGGGTGNAFPALAYCIRGTGGSAAHATWCQATNHGTPKFQIAATNVITNAGVSADGTFWIVMGYPAVNSTSMNGFGFMRMDDTEDGDVDPFITIPMCTSTLNRTQALNTGNAASWSLMTTLFGQTTSYLGWRRRGFSTNDAYQSTYGPSALICGRASTNVNTFINEGFFSSISASIFNFSTAEKVACHPLSITVREPVYVSNNTVATAKQRKGAIRWMYIVPTGAGYDTWDSASYIQVLSASSTQLGIILGPWDGTTSPTQT